jgi:anti-sigma-K factor RskA
MQPMNNKLTYEQVSEMLSAYVLGALEPEEILAVDDYVHKHQALLDSLRESEEAAAQLAYLAPMEPLTADAKDRLLTRARADSAGLAPRAAAPPPQQQAVAEPASYPGRLANLQAALGAFKPRVAVAGVLILVSVLLGLYIIPMQTRLRQSKVQREVLQAEVTRLRATNDQLQQTNRILQQQLQTEQERLAFIAETSADRIVLLTGTEELPGASGALYFHDDQQGLLLLNGLEPLSEQRTYQLWLIPPDQAPVPAGLIDVQPGAPAWLSVRIPPEAQAFAAVGVSIEPAGGSLAPTGPIVLLGTSG